MQRRTNLTHSILAIAIALGLTPLMVVVDAQARIAFESDRDGHVRDDIPNFPGIPAYEIYVMDADGGNPQNLTNNPHSEARPAWLNSPFSVSPTGKGFTMWGRLKQISR